MDMRISEIRTEVSRIAHEIGLPMLAADIGEFSPAKVAACLIRQAVHEAVEQTGCQAAENHFEALRAIAAGVPLQYAIRGLN